MKTLKLYEVIGLTYYFFQPAVFTFFFDFAKVVNIWTMLCTSIY